MAAGGPATAVAEIVVPPDKPSTDTASALVPGRVPRTQPPTVARPDPSVIAESPLIEPPPEATTNRTTLPGTPFPRLSFTRTAGGTAVAVPTDAC